MNNDEQNNLKFTTIGILIFIGWIIGNLVGLLIIGLGLIKLL